MQVVVDSLLTHYEKSGHGKKTILLLHGWGDSLATFKQLQTTLAKSYGVISLDLPGFGASQAPKAVWNLNDYATFLSNFLQKIDNSLVYAVVAHSNGGALAIVGISQHKLVADKLVLLAASGIRDRQNMRRFITKIVAKAGKLLTFWLPEHHKQRLRKKLYGTVGSDMLVAPHLVETFKQTVRQDVQADATHLTIPTLLIYGADDTATPPEYGRTYQRLIKGSRLEIVDGAEHFVHHDRPEQVEQLIEGFLS